MSNNKGEHGILLDLIEEYAAATAVETCDRVHRMRAAEEGKLTLGGEACSQSFTEARIKASAAVLAALANEKPLWSEVVLEEAIIGALRERSAADVGSLCARIIESLVDGVWVTAIVTPKEDPCG